AKKWRVIFTHYSSTPKRRLANWRGRFQLSKQF
ncbi:uncharacterized protein METZ01_LOCUS480541, partial [marine metagenome]